MFYFEQLLLTALSGIDSYNITSTVLGVAGTILLLSFLYSAYQAFAMGGDVRMLAIGGITYLILGLVFVNYGTVFRAVISMFNSVADFIYSSVGVGDLFNQWLNDLSNYFNQGGQSSLWGLIDGGISGFLGALLIIVAFIILPLSYTLFTLFYALYGTVLYVVGPFVLALLPARGFGQTRADLSPEPDGLRGMGIDLRDPPSLDDCREHGQSQRRIERQWLLERFLGLRTGDSSGSREHRVFDCHSLHSVYCQPNRAG